MPKLDTDALRKAIIKGQAAAIGSIGPGGRPRTGTKAFVREHVDAIVRLRNETGATWAQMVVALGATYDLRSGDGQLMTGRRLNALVSACLKERARKAATGVQRASRPDLSRATEAAPLPRAAESKASTPAIEPRQPAEISDMPATPITEDEIRRGQRDRHQHLFKQG